MVLLVVFGKYPYIMLVVTQCVGTIFYYLYEFIFL